MKLTVINLDCNADGVDFWKHTHYKVRVNDQIVSHQANALETLEIIEEEMRKNAYSSRIGSPEKAGI